MSYYIEHNRAVAKTKDGYYFLLTRGGDNNVWTADTNKRLVSWSRIGSFVKNERALRCFAFALSGDFVGGGIQLPSGSRTSSGTKPYDSFFGRLSMISRAYKRYLKEIESPIETDVSLSEIAQGEKRISDLDKAVLEGLQEKGKSILDQDGYRQYQILGTYKLFTLSEEERKSLKNKDLAEIDKMVAKKWIERAEEAEKDYVLRYSDDLERFENLLKTIKKKGYVTLGDVILANDVDFARNIPRTADYLLDTGDLADIPPKARQEISDEMFEAFLEIPSLQRSLGDDMYFKNNMFYFPELFPKKLHILFGEAGRKAINSFYDREVAKARKYDDEDGGKYISNLEKTRASVLASLDAFGDFYRELNGTKDNEKIVEEAQKAVNRINEAFGEKKVELSDFLYGYEKFLRQKEWLEGLERNGFKARDPEILEKFSKRLESELEKFEYRNIDKIVDMRNFLYYKNIVPIDPGYAREKTSFSVRFDPKTVGFQMKKLYPRKFAYAKRFLTTLWKEMGEYLNDEVRRFINEYTGEKIAPYERNEFLVPLRSFESLKTNSFTPKEMQNFDSESLRDGETEKIYLEDFGATVFLRKESDNIHIEITVAKEGDLDKRFEFFVLLLREEHYKNAYENEIGKLKKLSGNTQKPTM